MPDLDRPMTQQAFADLLGISRRSVCDLAARGILSPNASGLAWLRAYCDRLREQAAGRAAAGDLDLATERARLAREQADKIAMQNAVARGELAPASLIQEVLAKAGTAAGRILDTIPGEIRRRELGVTAETVDAIAAIVAKARNTFASITLRDIGVEFDDDDSTDPTHTGSSS